MNYRFTFIAEGTKQLVSVDNCDVYSDLLTYNKFLELKMPNGGRAMLVKSFHYDLIVSLRNKIRHAYDKGELTFDVDVLYEEVLKENTKKYFYRKGTVNMPEGKTYTKRIYSTGNYFFYKDKESNNWVQVTATDKKDDYNFLRVEQDDEQED